MYEQRRKALNKASAEALYCLSRVLGCTMEDLLNNDSGHKPQKETPSVRIRIQAGSLFTVIKSIPSKLMKQI